MDYVQHYLFADLDNIRQIFLQDNQLTFIHPKAFADNTQLARLFLHNNKLKSLDKEWFKKITSDDNDGSSTLEELYFDGNELHCNCELHRFTSWAMENRKMRSLIQDMGSKGNVPKCHGPQDLKGKEFYSVTTDDFTPCKEPQIIDSKKIIEKTHDAMSVTLRCEASGEPTPSIHWFKKGAIDGDEIELTSIDETVYDQSHIVGRVFIPKAQKEDVGNYFCVAQNTNGRVESTQERIDQSELAQSLDMYPKIDSPDSPKLSPERLLAESPSSPLSPNSPESFGKSQNEDFYHDMNDNKFDYTKDKFDIEAIDTEEEYDPDDYDPDDYDDEECPDECFCDFKYQRQWVDCRDGGIDDITDVLENIPEEVNVLDLKDNDMNQIPDGAFMRFSQLDTLHLDDNEDLGDSMGKEVFRGLFNLKQLTAKDISLSAIGVKLIPLSNLKTLVLSKNDITKISRKNFLDLNKLEDLHLDYNQISSIEKEAFYSLHSLKYLYLQGNNLRSIEVEWFTPFSVNLFIHAYLNANPISCDCYSVGSFALAEDRHGMLEDTGMDCDLEQMKNLQCTAEDTQRDRIQAPAMDPILIQELLGHRDQSKHNSGIVNFDRILASDMDNKDELVDRLLMQHLGLTDKKSGPSESRDFYEDLQYDNILPDHPVKNTHDDILTDVSSFDDTEQSNTTWVITVFLAFALFLLIATFKQWRRALLRLLLRCGDNSNLIQLLPGRSTSQYQRLAQHGSYSRRETLI